VTASSVGELREIPEPESSDAKEVFSFFGLCSYCAQVLEEGLINLAVGLRIRGQTRLVVGGIDLLFEEIGKRTLGQLIKDVRRHVDVPAEIEKTLQGALQDRNFLAHRFFASHDIDFASARGRTEMITELRQITDRFQRVDGQLQPITDALWERLGITKEMIQGALAKMKAEAKQRDTICLQDL